MKNKYKKTISNLNLIHKNTKKIAKVSHRLDVEIKNRIQGDKDTLEKAKRYTDQQVKKKSKEPWYDQIADFFKNLPKMIEELLDWIKKIIPIILAVLGIGLVIYLIKTFGFNPCRPCMNYAYKRKARQEAIDEARKQGITLKTLDEERLKVDMRESYKRGDMTSGRFYNYYHQQMNENVDTPTVALLNMNATRNITATAAHAAETPARTWLACAKVFFVVAILLLLVIVQVFMWIYLETHQWLAIMIAIVLNLCTIVLFKVLVSAMFTVIRTADRRQPAEV